MILYYYEHCPFCLRVRTFAGLKKINLSLKLMAFADIDTPVNLCGKKQAPILQKDDGAIMAESSDIIAYLDAFKGNRLLDNYNCDPDLEACLESLSKLHLCLTSPLYVRLKGIEFENKSDQERYINREEQHMGISFSKALQKKELLKEDMQAKLKNSLVPLLEKKQFLKSSEALFSRIVLFVFLRKLTLVKNLVLPQSLELFFKDFSQKTGLGIDLG
tara:strand:- start:1270 stop:1920 length:651 start_codon:yes stop_codon:yes gene_type:complete